MYDESEKRQNYILMQEVIADLPLRERAELGRQFDTVSRRVEGESEGYAQAAAHLDSRPDWVFVFGASRGMGARGNAEVHANDNARCSYPLRKTEVHDGHRPGRCGVRSGNVVGPAFIHSGNRRHSERFRSFRKPACFYQKKMAFYIGKIHPNEFISLSLYNNDERSQFLNAENDGNLTVPSDGTYAGGAAFEYRSLTHIHARGDG